jgi:hypothetical protein
VPFAASLVVPFALEELREAIDWGLAWGAGRRGGTGTGAGSTDACEHPEAGDGRAP